MIMVLKLLSLSEKPHADMGGSDLRLPLKGELGRHSTDRSAIRRNLANDVSNLIAIKNVLRAPRPSLSQPGVGVRYACSQLSESNASASSQLDHARCPRLLVSED